MKISVTSDNSLKNEIREALKKNNGYCPCSLIKSKDTLCMCKEFLEQNKLGPCNCGLYIKEEI